MPKGIPQSPSYHIWHAGSHQTAAKLYLKAVGVQRFSRKKFVMASFGVIANLKISLFLSKRTKHHKLGVPLLSAKGLVPLFPIGPFELRASRNA
jgi:hypothetical protein